MSNTNNQSLEFIFHPRSTALVGITTTNSEHWTRTFLDSFLELRLGGQMCLVNPNDGQIKGLMVHTINQDISDSITTAKGDESI